VAVDDPFVVDLDGGRHARAVRVETLEDLAGAVHELDVGRRAAIVVVGGASGMSADEVGRLAPVFDDVLAPLAQRLDVTVIDGGSDSGVMRLMGSARGENASTFPLIGVIVDELADYSSDSSTRAVGLEPNHTHFVLVPGSQWGEEAPWLANLATVVAGDEGSATVCVNGGEIALADVPHSIDAGRHVVMVTVEADVVVGRLIKERADAAGVMYSLAYGDEPALAAELCDWARSLGFRVIAAGKGTRFIRTTCRGSTGFPGRTTTRRSFVHSSTAPSTQSKWRPWQTRPA